MQPTASKPGPRFAQVVIWALPLALLYLSSRSPDKHAQWLERFRFDRALLASEPWRAGSAALIHIDLTHAAVNGLMWVLLCLYAQKMQRLGAAVVAALVATPLAHAGLLLWPQAIDVAGLSATLYALWAALTVFAMASREQRELRWLGFASAALLAFKVFADQAWAQPVAPSVLWNFPVVHAVHLTGMALGAVVAFFMLYFSALTSASGPAAAAQAADATPAKAVRRGATPAPMQRRPKRRKGLEAKAHALQQQAARFVTELPWVRACLGFLQGLTQRFKRKSASVEPQIAAAKVPASVESVNAALADATPPNAAPPDTAPSNSAPPIGALNPPEFASPKRWWSSLAQTAKQWLGRRKT
jgi:membrane associated rhomboid family serine protease